MIAIPAADLREGTCVQLVGGSYDDERIRLADPCGVARLRVLLSDGAGPLFKPAPEILELPPQRRQLRF